jgi:predicted MFS family arabinose efflux permease
LSVGALALGAFVIVMTETLPVGLLPQIADGLDVSLALGGLMVLVPGFTAAVSAPLFFLGSGRSNRRPVILFLGLSVLVSNVVVAVAPSFVLVLIARMLFGATLGAFWTVVAPVGPKLVAQPAELAQSPSSRPVFRVGRWWGCPRDSSSATSSAGVSLRDCGGGDTAWRGCADGRAARYSADARTHLRDLVEVVTRRAARFGMAAGAMAFIGQFAAWTYLSPFLMDHMHLSSGVISLLYVIYGCGGTAGLLIAGSLFKRGVIGSFAGAAMVVAALLIGLASAGALPWLAGLLLVLWGLFWGIVSPATLVWILDAAPETPEAASAVNVTNLQLAVAAGSGLGAILISSTTLHTVFLTAGFIVLAAAVLAAVAAQLVTLARRQ